MGRSWYHREGGMLKIGNISICKLMFVEIIVT